MIAVLRIAFAYFSFAPVQRWINGIGVALLLLALATLPPGTYGAVTGFALGSAMLGLILIAFVPLMVGGAVLRISSSRCVLHLRPHGRLRMLLGATLAITLVAGLATLAMLMPLHTAHPDLPAPWLSLTLFGAFWGCTALWWLGVFIAANSRLGMMLIWLVPFAAGGLVKLLGAHLLGWPVFLPGLIGWAAFALWYQNAFASANWQWLPKPAASMQPAATNEEIPLAQARRQYLLDVVSPQTHVLIGLSVLLSVLLLLQIPKQHGDPAIRLAAPLLMFLQALMTFYSMLGQSAARRARLLWLRAGLDRRQLFSLAERQGLAAAALALAIPLLALLLNSLLYRPDLAMAATLLVLVEAAFATAMCYWGLSLTSGRALVEGMQAAGWAALFVLHIHLLEPSRGPRAMVLAWELVLLITLSLLLRWHARRRWLSLDWRVLRLPPRIYRLS